VCYFQQIVANGLQTSKTRVAQKARQEGGAYVSFSETRGAACSSWQGARPTPSDKTEPRDLSLHILPKTR
jgi:hypothetical protein